MKRLCSALASLAAITSAASCGLRNESSDAASGDGAAAALEALPEIAWIDPNTDIVSVLSQRPGECLRTPTDPDEIYLVEVGRAAFRSPFLFGGPAARSGLSCNACHSDGRQNAAFFIEGFSGAPGSADVTSSLFSKERGDDIFNPVAIPDLVDAAGKTTFGTMAPVATIHDFVATAVADEFQGAPPPQSVLDGVAAYVAHLDSAACERGPVLRSPDDELGAARRALAAAIDALARDDVSTAEFLLLSARHELGRIDERLFAPSHKAHKRTLRELSKEIAMARQNIAQDRDITQAAIMTVIDKIDTNAAGLMIDAFSTLYEKAVLARASSD